MQADYYHMLLPQLAGPCIVSDSIYMCTVHHTDSNLLIAGGTPTCGGGGGGGVRQQPCGFDSVSELGFCLK